jgi:histidinol-phosphate aminotransferase
MSAPTRPQPRPGVLDIEAYVPGKSSAPGVAKVFKLSSNETPLGASPQAIAAYRAHADQLHDYPDGPATALREAIARTYGLDPARIICGTGSDDLLNLIARTYLRDGDEAIHTTHGFLVYPIATLGTGAKPVVAGERNFTADVDAILAAVSPRTKVVFLANPNNPTGTYIPADRIASFLEQVPERVTVILDEAYIEFQATDDPDATLDLLPKHPNLVLLRTFSKCYGLAGLRVGYALGTPQFRSAVDAVRQPFSVNAIAQAAASEAILHQDDVTDRVEKNLVERLFVEEGLQELGLEAADSQANFSWFSLGDRDESEVMDSLARAGVAVRPGTPLGGPGHLRVTYGTRPENERFLAALREALA